MTDDTAKVVVAITCRRKFVSQVMDFIQEMPGWIPTTVPTIEAQPDEQNVRGAGDEAGAGQSVVEPVPEPKVRKHGEHAGKESRVAGSAGKHAKRKTK